MTIPNAAVYAVLGGTAIVGAGVHSASRYVLQHEPESTPDQITSHEVADDLISDKLATVLTGWGRPLTFLAGGALMAVMGASLGTVPMMLGLGLMAGGAGILASKAGEAALDLGGAAVDGTQSKMQQYRTS